MASGESEGLSDEMGAPQQPESVAEELANTEPSPAELPAAVREDQVQNAVQGSTKAAKESFLEKKGLRAEEIEEAFRRVPQTSAGSEPVATTYQPVTRQAGVAAARKPFPIGSTATVSALQPVTYAAQPLQPVREPIRWTQVVIGASVIVAGAYAVKQLVGPYATRWYQKWSSGGAPSLEDAKHEEERRTADAIAQAIQSQTAELRATVESMKEMVAALNKDGVSAPADSLADSLADIRSDLRTELRSFATTLSEFASPGKTGELEPEVKDEIADLKAQLSSLTARLPSHTAPKARASLPAVPPNSYTSFSSGPITNGTTSVAPPASRYPYREEAKVVEPARASSASPVHSDTAVDSAPDKVAQDGPTSSQANPPHPASYMEVLEMLERGETPPGIRSDINDKPPNPGKPPPSATMQPRSKPWERAQSGSPESRSSTGPSRDFGSRSHSPLPGGHLTGTTITELPISPDNATAPTASAAPSSSGGWKPPAVPQPSIKIPSARSSAASVTSQDD